MHHLEIKELSARYGRLDVLHGVTFAVGRGEVVSLIGPSGSGKSTLLRVLMGLTHPTGGEVRVDGEPVNYNSHSSLRTARDRMAIVFQQYNLFQNMDVMRNVTLAPVKIKKRARREVEDGARFAVHSWRDNRGREARDFAQGSPEHRYYLDYYREMGMSDAGARSFYAMTNSVPNARARWLDAEDMRGWLARTVGAAANDNQEDAQPRIAYLDVTAAIP